MGSFSPHQERSNIAGFGGRSRVETAGGKIRLRRSEVWPAFLTSRSPTRHCTMDTSQEREQWTHEEVVAGARQSLLAELEIEDSELGQAFLVSPIGPRVRVGGVR